MKRPTGMVSYANHLKSSKDQPPSQLLTMVSLPHLMRQKGNENTSGNLPLNSGGTETSALRLFPKQPGQIHAGDGQRHQLHGLEDATHHRLGLRRRQNKMHAQVSRGDARRRLPRRKQDCKNQRARHDVQDSKIQDFLGSRFSLRLLNEPLSATVAKASLRRQFMPACLTRLLTIHHVRL